eukprot:contig_21249_g5220
MYETATWRQTVCGSWGRVHLLAGAHRHARDLQLLEVLRRIRVGEQRDKDIAFMNATSAGATAEEWDTHTQVRATNAGVDAVNSARLAALPVTPVEFVARDEVFVTHPARRGYVRHRLAGMVADTKVFKVDAAVILTRTVGFIASGTQGKVMEIVAGMYVVCVFWGDVVRVRPAAFDFVDNCGEKLATRFQVPLVLGWAVTIHRTQGLTLESLASDFTGQCWKAEGLVYSGLTRCPTARVMMVRSLRHELIVASPRALRFCNSFL